MSTSAYVLLVFGAGGLVVLIWWVMLKALTSKKSIHKGPVEIASPMRARAGHEPKGRDHADRHLDHWKDDMHNTTAVNAELGIGHQVQSDSNKDIRRSAVQGTEAGMDPSKTASQDPPAPGSK